MRAFRVDIYICVIIGCFNLLIFLFQQVGPCGYGAVEDPIELAAELNLVSGAKTLPFNHNGGIYLLRASQAQTESALNAFACKESPPYESKMKWQL